jgi:hypothetical protein
VNGRGWRGGTALVDVRPPYEIRVVTEPFADPRRILARLHLVVPGGRPSGVHIWCIFHFDHDGMIIEVEEMLDTAAADMPH